MIKSWKTTVLGCIIIGWALFAWSIKGTDGTTAVALVSVGLGLIFSKDYNVSGTKQ